jgi:hypothetical protein
VNEARARGQAACALTTPLAARQHRGVLEGKKVTVVMPAFAMEMVCCSMASCMATCSCSQQP